MQLEGLITQQAIEEEGAGARQRAAVAGMSAAAYSRSVLPQFGGSLLSGVGEGLVVAKKYGLWGL